MKLIKRFLDGGKYVNVPLWSLDPMKRSEINNYMESQGLNPNSLSQLFAFTDAPASMEEGGEFKENLNPPTNGVLGELKRNVKNGWLLSKQMISSLPLNILLGGIGSGITGINMASKAKQFTNWLVKDPNPGLDQISALGWIGTGPALGIAMFDPFRWSKSAKNEDEIKKYGASSKYDKIRKQEDYEKALLIKRQDGGQVERTDKTRVPKPIPSKIPANSEVRTYDNVPVRVNKNYPNLDKYQLEAPTRELNLPWKKLKVNVKYPHVYGIELTSLLPLYMLVINGNDTTYYVQGRDDLYYPAAGQSSRPIFREMFNKQASPSKYSTRRVPYNFVSNLK